MRVQAAEAVHRVLDVVDAAVEFFADLRIAVHLQIAEMIAHKQALEIDVMLIRKFVIRFDGVKLKQKTLTKIARPNAGRLQLLHELEGRLKRFGRQRFFGFALDGFKVGSEIPLGIDVIDDRFAGLFNFGRGFDERPLAQKMVAQRDVAGRGVVHRVELFVALAVIAGGLPEARAGVGGKLFVFKILGDPAEPVEILGIVVFLDDQGLLPLGSLITAVGLAGFGRRDDLVILRPVSLLQNRVILHLLFDAFPPMPSREAGESPSTGSCAASEADADPFALRLIDLTPLITIVC